jgi:hypothetical protein
MKMIRVLLMVLAFTLPELIISGQTRNFSDTVAIYFQEIQANTAKYKDLWNIDLYGPVLLVDPVSRSIYANYPDSTGALKKEGTIYTGHLPDAINIANTSIMWNGTSWAMIMLPLPENIHDRLDLLSHELFHRSQTALGFHTANSDNNHLDKRDGRIYLRLEVEALHQALQAVSGSQKTDQLADAIFFRKTRYSLFKGAGSSENQMELNEGLAAYTGIIMSDRNDNEIKEYFEQKLVEFQSWPTFVRSFAYVTVPLYGIILRNSDKGWNLMITDNTNLTDFFIKSFGISVPVNLCPVCISQYGFERITEEETRRESEKEQRIIEYKTVFTKNPHLEIKLEKMNISFDPRNLIPLEGYGTVYPTMRISDNWGILTVTMGALLGSNWDKVILSNPVQIATSTVSGKGWILELSQGYSVEKDPDGRNFMLKKKEIR